MGPAFELFLLFVLIFGAGVGAAAYFTRPLWRRAAKTIIERDRDERAALEQQAQERADEAECRRRAEEELQRSLRGEEVPGLKTARQQAPLRREPTIPCEEQKIARIQSEEHP